MRHLAIAIGLTAGLLAAGAARAEIVKTATVDCNKGICLHRWPKIVVPDGWKTDLDFSQAQNINFIYPEADPNNVGIYAGARSIKGQADTLDGFMQDDRSGFEKRNPGMKTLDGPVFTTADGQKLRSVFFNPAGVGNWDLTAYGEESDGDGNRYYLTFSVSTPTELQQKKYLPVFTQVIAAYHK